MKKNGISKKMLAILLAVLVLISVIPIAISATATTDNTSLNTGETIAPSDETDEIIIVPVTEKYSEGTDFAAVSVSGALETDEVTYKLNDGRFTKNLPTISEVGSYTITVRVERNGEIIFEDSVISSIVKNDIVLTVTEYNADYDKLAHPALTVAEAQKYAGKISYVYNGETLDAPPEITAVGNYSVTVNVNGVHGYNDFSQTYSNIKITAADIADYKVVPYSGIYDGKEHDAVSLEPKNLSEGDSVSYQYNDGEWTDTPLVITEVGTYNINVKFNRTDLNYKETIVPVVAEIKAAPWKLQFNNENYKDCAYSSVTFETGKLYDFSAVDNTFETPSTEGITYSFSGTADITKDELNGTFTLNSPGSVFIKAEKAASEDGRYKDTTIVYTLIAAAPKQGLAYFSPDSIDYIFGENEYVVSTNTANLLYSGKDNGTLSYSETSEYVDIDKTTGKVTVNEANEESLSKKLEDGNVKIKVTATKSDSKETVQLITGKDENGFIYKDQAFVIYPSYQTSYEITIKTIEISNDSYVISGTKVNGWYNGEIIVTPADPEKYLISKSTKRNSFKEQITYSNQGSAARCIYLREKNGWGISKKLFLDDVKIDSEAPDLSKMEVTFSEPNGIQKFFDKILWFYNPTATVTIVLRDETGTEETGGEESGVDYFTWEYSGETNETGIPDETGTLKAELKEDRKGLMYTATLQLPTNDASQYRGNIALTATDIAGNTPESVVIPNDNGENIIIVIDTVRPEMSVSHERVNPDSSYQEYNGEFYYNDDVKFTINIKEANFFPNTVIAKVKKDSKEESLTDSDIEWTNDGDNNIGTFTLQGEGDYEVFVSYTDDAGNATEQGDYNSGVIHIDNTAPVIEVTYSAASGQFKGDDLYGNNKNGKTINLEAYLNVTERNFFSNHVEVTVTKDGEVMQDIPEISWENKSGYSHIGTLILNEEGEYEIDVKYTDLSSNEMEPYSTDNKKIIDRSAPVINIEYKNKDVINTFDTRKYFNDTQTAVITITERYFDEDAVANAVKYTISNVDVSGKANEAAVDYSNWKSKDDTHTITLTFDDESNYTFDIDCTDIANNVSADYTPDLFTVDKTAPQLNKISYSEAITETTINNVPYGFYNDQMTVTIEAWDNISPINNFSYSYDLASGVSSVNEAGNGVITEDPIGNPISVNGYTSTASFNIPKSALSANNQFNGTIRFNATDRSGNAQKDDFKDNKRIVVDNIAPVGEVSYNQHVNLSNGVYYYDGNIQASVRINEANFYAEDVVVSVTKDGASYSVSPSWRSESADIHYGTFTLSGDGDYIVTVNYTDKSGNRMTEYKSDQLTIDTQIEKPTFSINGVSKTENGGAYKGNATVSFSFTDKNFDTHSVRLIRKGFSKEEDVTNKFVKVGLNANGGSGSFTIPKTVENDGIYEIRVTMTDKARHSTEATLKFTINRFGSVYEYSDYLSSLIKDGGQYITSVSEDLIITEYNADRILKDSLKIMITRDGESIDVDYETNPVEIEKASIGTTGWYEYVYTIKASNFADDGVYKISLSSEYSTTDSKNVVSTSIPENSTDTSGNNILDTMNFTVDATKPVIRNIVNLENAIVNAETLNVKYTIVDVGGLKSIEVILNGETVDTVTDFADSQFNYSGEFEIKENKEAQNISFRATDLAGNVQDTTTKEFKDSLKANPLYVFNDTVTVSTNFFVRFYANKPLFWGSIISIIVVIAAVWFIIAFKRKKN